MESFCDIKNREDLANFLKIPLRHLTHLLYVKKVDNCYTTFTIPKKSGGERQICAPNRELMAVQRKIANKLWEYQKSLRCDLHTIPNISHAFEKDKSIITNAVIHRNKRFVLNLDLKDFFPSIHFGRVLGFFQKNRNFKLPYEVAVILAQLTCYNGSLPQGAPTSPIISNWICQILDMRLLSISKKYKLDYTRYADDLTFSTNNRNFLDIQSEFMDELVSEIERSGFSVNDKKTRLSFRDSRQEVTGLIVNKKINIDRRYVRTTRAMAHELYKKGHYFIDGTSGTLAQLEGRFSFIDHIDHYNNRHDSKERHTSYCLNGRESQYREFLFYKYFVSPELPIIITEGKTDILYLKAALKNLYSLYPNLVERDDTGNFKFKVSFFKRSLATKRSSRLSYFFGISTEGADAITHLYRYFTGKNGCPNYPAHFKEICESPSNPPIIFIFDNETQSKRPLRKFMNEISSNTDEIRKQLLENLYATLPNDANSYLLTNPLVNDLPEAEIEDLFPQELLSLKINEKTFQRDGKGDPSLFYGKDIFSKYVMNHYQEIDFSNFKPMLDALSKIVDNDLSTRQRNTE